MKKTLALGISIISLLVTGSALSFGWNTFILRIFSIPRLDVPTALGIALLYELVVWKYQNTTNISDNEWIIRARSGLSASLATLLMLFILSLF